MASFSNPVLIVDVASKRIIEVTDAAVALTGYAKDELIRMTLDDIYTPDTVAAILNTFSNCPPVNFDSPIFFRDSQ